MMGGRRVLWALHLCSAQRRSAVAVRAGPLFADVGLGCETHVDARSNALFDVLAEV